MGLDYEIYDLGDVKLQRGATLRDCKLAYKTFGTLSPNKDNVIVYPTWYSGQHYDNEWLIGDGRALRAEDEDDDGEPQRHLGHGDGDGERGEDHAHHVGVVAREGDQVDVDGVEHQLDAEQDADGVPPRHHAEEADGEEHRGEREVGAETHCHSSGRAK